MIVVERNALSKLRVVSPRSAVPPGVVVMEVAMVVVVVVVVEEVVVVHKSALTTRRVAALVEVPAVSRTVAVAVAGVVATTEDMEIVVDMVVVEAVMIAMAVGVEGVGMRTGTDELLSNITGLVLV